MLINCPECSSPVFVRSAAIEKSKPQRCYSCKSQLLVTDNGAVEVAVKGDGGGPAASPPPKPASPPASYQAQATQIVSPNITAAATAPQSNDADSTAIVDLSDEAVPIDEDEGEATLPPGRVNAMFSGTISSAEGDTPNGVPAPAPVFLGELDLDAPESTPNQIAPAPAPITQQSAALTTDEPEPDQGWPTMISQTPFGGASGEILSPAQEPLSAFGLEPALPKSDPLLAQPTQVSDASARVAETELGALTQEPSEPSYMGEPAVEAPTFGGALGGDLSLPGELAPPEEPPEPTRLEEGGPASLPRVADNRFGITGEDSDEAASPHFF
ncbi:MAG: hypothetical protein ACYTFT_18370, partial [Planctomycetota bacterium]